METPGLRLKQLRLEKGLSLEDVQKKTKIHLNILKAIEGDSISDVSPIYLKSFLKIYCECLGVDPKDFVVDTKAGKPKPAQTAFVKKPVVKEQQSSSFASNALSALAALRPNKKVVSSIVLAVVFFMVAAGLFNLGKFIILKYKQRAYQEKLLRPKESVAKQELKKKQKKAAVTPLPIKPAAKAERAAEQASEPKTQVSKLDENILEIRLTILAKDNCYVVLKSDNHVVFQRQLERGRSESWSAKDRMELFLGSAGAVELQVNGKTFSNLGRKNQSIRGIIITREGLKIPR